MSRRQTRVDSYRKAGLPNLASDRQCTMDLAMMNLYAKLYGCYLGITLIAVILGIQYFTDMPN